MIKRVEKMFLGILLFSLALSIKVEIFHTDPIDDFKRKNAGIKLDEIIAEQQLDEKTPSLYIIELGDDLE